LNILRNDLRLVLKEALTHETAERRRFVVTATHFPAGFRRLACKNLCKIKTTQIAWLSTLTKSSDTT